ncbi:MAG: ABC transporter substrate-binding protein [Armatimonadota bacterium]|nr:ABC transporter substrate-binding protein [Armatimonadota bacterium]MDR7550359.1 ABC transporter substrate-binding protein [Armatimonadota bacterium]
MTGRRTALLVAVVLAAGMLARPAALSAQIPLKIGYPVWVGYGPLFLAEKKGFLKELGTSVEFILMEDTKPRYVALAAKRIDGLMTTIDTVVQRVKPDLQMAAILAMDDSKGGDGIVARKEIQSVRDLKGKKVAFSEGSVSHFFLAFLLQQHGMSLRDITPVNMTAGDAGAAFVAGKVDAAVTWEPWLTRGKQAAHGKVLVDSSATPNLIVDVLVFRKDVIKARPKDMENLVRAWVRAVDFWKANPDEANKIMAEAVGGWLKDPKVFAETLTGIRYYDAAALKEFFGTKAAPGAGYKTAQFAIDLWTRLGKAGMKGIKAADILDGSFVK